MVNRSLVLACCVASVFSAGAFAAEPAHWSYGGAEGPEHWADLAASYGACAGRNQSPIDLKRFIEAELPPIAFSYAPGGTEAWNNGHTVQVGYAAGSSIELDGIRFELKQVHFHAPSENHIDGRAFPLEAHLVHADADGNLAVVAVMFEAGADNAALARVWSAMPESAGAKVALAKPFAAADLLPADRDYYRFEGSLTTPPCTEGVRWLVIKKPVSASQAQVDRFAHLMHHANNRPVQPVYARVVLE